MKFRTLLVIAFVSLHVFKGFAQFSQGSSTVGLNTTLTYNGSQNLHGFLMRIQPDYGYFVFNQYLTGIKAGIDYQFIRYSGSRRPYHVLGKMIGVYGIQYFPMENGHFGVFLSQTANLTFYGRDISSPSTSELLYLALSPGVFIFFSERNAFEIKFGEAFLNYQYVNNTASYGISLSGSSFQFGVRHFFGSTVPIPKDLSKKRLGAK